MEKRLLERFRRTLKERRDALHLRLIPARHQNNLSLCDVNGGYRSTASLAIETFLEQAQAENLLEAVNAALDRIDTGSFGRCSNCGQEIIPEHLEATPWTRYCISCQPVVTGF